jgi:hypothetical protein
MSVTEGQLLWTPGKEFANGSNIAKYINWLKEKTLLKLLTSMLYGNGLLIILKTSEHRFGITSRSNRTHRWFIV